MDVETLKRNYASTLLGRLRLKLYEMISGNLDRFPNPREKRLYLLDVYKRSALEGQIFFDILGLNVETEISFPGLQDPADVRALIQSLEEDPLEQVVFVELHNCPAPAPANLGMLIHRENLDPAGFFYV